MINNAPPANVTVCVWMYFIIFTACYICFLFKLYLNSIRGEINHRAVRHPVDIIVMFQVIVRRQHNANMTEDFKGIIQHYLLYCQELNEKIDTNVPI